MVPTVLPTISVRVIMSRMCGFISVGGASSLRRRLASAAKCCFLCRPGVSRHPLRGAVQLHPDAHRPVPQLFKLGAARGSLSFLLHFLHLVGSLEGPFGTVVLNKVLALPGFAHGRGFHSKALYLGCRRQWSIYLSHIHISLSPPPPSLSFSQNQWKKYP